MLPWKRSYFRTLIGNSRLNGDADEARKVYEMLIPLGKWTGSGLSRFYWYTCKHYDRETHRCLNYENRPVMCRRYPDEKQGCEYDVNCGHGEDQRPFDAWKKGHMAEEAQEANGNGIPMMPWERIGASIGRLVYTKQKAYGDSFGKAGDMLRILYPNGVTPEQMDDMLTVARVIDKLFRVATDRDALGESPWRDVVGYGLLAVHRVERGAAHGKWVEPDAPAPKRTALPVLSDTEAVEPSKAQPDLAQLFDKISWLQQAVHELSNVVIGLSREHIGARANGDRRTFAEMVREKAMSTPLAGSIST